MLRDLFELTVPAWLLVAVAAVSALGVLVVLPGERISALEAQQTAVAARVDRVERVTAALGKDLCWRSTPELRVWLDIPCDELLRNAPARLATPGHP